jgi:hypothetical protein
MPLLNHFRPPLSLSHPWQGFHSAWANALTQQLNQGLLPPRYYALPNVQLGGHIEIDVATLERNGGTPGAGRAGATAVWAPPRPPVRLPVDLAKVETVEVQVFHEEEGPRLRAAIELVSPANKDRHTHRQAFAIKWASYLQEGVGVVVVDVVTGRQANLYQELLTLMSLSPEGSTSTPPELYAVSSRLSRSGGQSHLEAWPEILSLGARLPQVPFWLEADCCLPLDLEPSYTAACASLRMPA